MYTIPKASEACGLKYSYLRHLVQSGKLPSVKVNYHYYISEIDLLRELLADSGEIYSRRKQEDMKEDDELRKIAKEHGVPYMVTLPDAALITGIPAHHYRSLIHAGKIPYYKCGDRYYVSFDALKIELNKYNKENTDTSCTKKNDI